jgi:hypothetical protein
MFSLQWDRRGSIRALFLRVSGQKGFIQRLSHKKTENKKATLADGSISKLDFKNPIQ